jgi:hypothetical protein
VTPLAEGLSRTLLLMRDEFGPDIDDSVLLDALTSTRVALIADAANIASYAAQTAFVTTAMLMARSGHQVFLMAPDVEMTGPQPRLEPGTIIDQLTSVGKDMLPGIEFTVGKPEDEVDLAIGLGDSRLDVRARRRIRLNAERWVGYVAREDEPRRWQTILWPFGALAAAGLGAGEAFKAAMHKLLPYALSAENTSARFVFADEAKFELAPSDTPFCRDLGEIDFVSGGAITNSILYCLAHIPGATAKGRIIEHDAAHVSNLNRYMLLLRSKGNVSKAPDLVQILGEGLHFRPLPERYDAELHKRIVPLAPTVVVGVDHIPTRWAVQEAKPDWLLIGATGHWSAMVSFHSEGLACARCLHDRDDPGNGPIPTTACVSFWAGLLSAAYLARHVAGQTISINEQQQVYLSPFRPDTVFFSGVSLRNDCPICHPASKAAHLTYR